MKYSLYGLPLELTLDVPFHEALAAQYVHRKRIISAAKTAVAGGQPVEQVRAELKENGIEVTAEELQETEDGWKV